MLAVYETRALGPSFSITGACSAASTLKKLKPKSE